MVLAFYEQVDALDAKPAANVMRYMLGGKSAETAAAPPASDVPKATQAAAPNNVAKNSEPAPQSPAIDPTAKGTAENSGMAPDVPEITPAVSPGTDVAQKPDPAPPRLVIDLAAKRAEAQKATADFQALQFQFNDLSTEINRERPSLDLSNPARVQKFNAKVAQQQALWARLQEEEARVNELVTVYNLALSKSKR